VRRKAWIDDANPSVAKSESTEEKFNHDMPYASMAEFRCTLPCENISDLNDMKFSIGREGPRHEIPKTSVSVFRHAEILSGAEGPNCTEFEKNIEGFGCVTP
jgi:hypothetical protein